MTQPVNIYMFILWTKLPFLRILNNLVYRISKETSTLERVASKTILLSKKIKHISNLDLIVIGGCPRSGTTLARALIGMHPKIACPQQESYFLLNIRNPSILKNTFDFSSEEINNLKAKHEDIVSFTEKVFKLYMQKEGKPFIAVKAPLYITVIDELFHYYPNMKFIHVIRDGRDTACSLREFPKRKIVGGKIVPTNIRNPFGWGIRLWISCLNRGRKWTKSNRYFEVKYEDLVNDSINSMEKIFDFLNVEMPDKNQLLSFHKYEKDERHPQNIEVGKPIYKTAVGRMKKDMSEKEKKKFKNLAGKMLIELGYAKDFDW